MTLVSPQGAADPAGGDAGSIGINSKVAPVDTLMSAQLSLDEAVRNLICSGGDPDHTCLVDNFCWPDPLPGPNNPDHAHKAAQLVRACRGLADTAIAWGMPFVSGKDSMKNDFSGMRPDGTRVKISIPPTVLVTAMAKVPDVRKLVTSDFKKSDAAIYVCGPMAAWPLEGSELCDAWQVPDARSDYPRFDLASQLDLYRKVHRAIGLGLIQSCHDVSDGGLFVALAESAIGGRKGAMIDSPHVGSLGDLFHEGPGRLVISVSPENEAAFVELLGGASHLRIGATNDAGALSFKNVCEDLLEFGVLELNRWWKGDL